MREELAEYGRHLLRLRRSEGTRRTYLAMLGVHLAWLESQGKHKAGEVTAADLEAFLVWLASERTHHDRPVSAPARANYIKTLKGFYSHLRNTGKVVADPAAQLRYPRKKRRLMQDALSCEALRRLLASPDLGTRAGLRDAVVLRLLALSGLRASEACGLDVADVDLAERELRIRGKGAKERIAFIEKGTLELLARYLAQNAGRQELFLSKLRHRFQPQNLRAIVRRHARRTGLPGRFTPHSLRRTFCTLLLQAGCNLKAIADLAGHERLSTTARYTQIHPLDLAQAYRQAHPFAEESHA